MEPFRYTRSYTGKIQAVVLDWAGTVMDFGCMAPTVVFQKVFENARVPITVEEARAPMGTYKKVHIREITKMSSVRKRWQDAHGRLPTEQDVEAMFSEFIPLQLACLSDYSTMIPGALDVVAQMKKRSYAIGSTTGYTQDMMDILSKDAENQGYKPDSAVCASDVPQGRPYPSMLLKSCIDLNVSSLASVVKVDDTTTGIEEGLNAGCWSIGVAVSGNDVGLTLEQWKELPKEEKSYLREKAYDKHRRAGAHYVVDSILELMPCLDDIERRLVLGEKP